MSATSLLCKGQTMPKVVVIKERCKACELCITFCPQECLALGDEINSAGFYPVELTNEDDCKSCAICSDMCPDMALEVYK